MEHFAQVIEQIDYKIAIIKFDIQDTELHLHKQLNAGVPEEQLSVYYSLLDTNEALKILQSELRKYKLDQ